jgi:hypothetical protein
MLQPHAKFRTIAFKLFSVCLALTSFGFCRSVVAQTDCSVFMKYGIYDKFHSETTKSHFEQVKSYFKEKSFGSYQQAIDSSTTVGLNVLDIVSLDFGGHDAKTEWSQWFNSFVNSNYSEVQDQSKYVESIEKVSGNITDIVKKCIESNEEGFFGWIVPAPDHTTITFNARFVRISGTPKVAKINVFEIGPPNVKVDCGPQGLAQFQKTKLITGEGQSVTCTRKANATVDFNLQTDQGRADPRIDAYEPPAASGFLTVTPTAIHIQQSAMLSWAIENASSLSIKACDGSGNNCTAPAGLGNNLSMSSSATVTPTQTTQYVLNATGQGGSIEKKATLTVDPHPAHAFPIVVRIDPAVPAGTTIDDVPEGEVALLEIKGQWQPAFSGQQMYGPTGTPPTHFPLGGVWNPQIDGMNRFSAIVKLINTSSGVLVKRFQYPGSPVQIQGGVTIVIYMNDDIFGDNFNNPSDPMTASVWRK